jgi:hypothetical protein
MASCFRDVMARVEANRRDEQNRSLPRMIAARRLRSALEQAQWRASPAGQEEQRLVREYLDAQSQEPGKLQSMLASARPKLGVKSSRMVPCRPS